MRILPRLVLDTNILVAAVRNRQGPSFALMQLVRRAQVQACSSPALFLEYEDVLKRPDQLLASGLREWEIDILLDDLAQFIVPVSVYYQWRPQLRDPGDEMVLEAAANASAQAIVTYNVRDFRAASAFGLAVLEPRRVFRMFDLTPP